MTNDRSRACVSRKSVKENSDQRKQGGGIRDALGGAYHSIGHVGYLVNNRFGD